MDGACPFLNRSITATAVVLVFVACCPLAALAATTTLTPSGGDDTHRIQTACNAGRVVLTDGVFHVSSLAITSSAKVPTPIFGMKGNSRRQSCKAPAAGRVACWCARHQDLAFIGDLRSTRRREQRVSSWTAFTERNCWTCR
jgi:hypothetical protein